MVYSPENSNAGYASMFFTIEANRCRDKGRCGVPASPPRTSTRPPHPPHTAPCPYNLMLVRCQPFLLQDIPHLPGSNGDIDVAHADMRKRIDNRVHDGL